MEDTLSNGIRFVHVDAAIVAAIAKGCTTFGAIMNDPDVRAECKRADCGENFRGVDQRLQALRKAGRIQYARRTGWTSATGA